jgi:hypothetical protein
MYLMSCMYLTAKHSSHCLLHMLDLHSEALVPCTQVVAGPWQQG